MTAVDSDIDKFIQQQKAKLANERNILNNSDRMNSAEYRRRWKDQHKMSPKGRAKWSQPRPLEVEPDNKTLDSEEYRRKWFEQRGKHMEPGRKQWQDAPVKLSPRGTLDTDRLIMEVQQEKEMEEYRDLWRKHQGQDASPRGPPPLSNRATIPPPQQPRGRPPQPHQQNGDDYKQRWQQQRIQGAPSDPRLANNKMPASALDTDAIIREVQQEKRALEERNNVLAGGGGGAPRAGNRGGAPGIGGAPAPTMDRDTYKRMWEQQNNKRGGTTQVPVNNRPNVAKLDTDAIIAEVTAEKLAEETRKLRQERQDLEASKALLEQQAALSPRAANGALLIKTDGEERLKQLREERNKEYNELLHQKRGYQSRPLREQTDEYKASTLGSNESDAAKLQKIKERNDEYNQFLASKADKQSQRRGGGAKTQGEEGVYATIPGLRYSTSAQKKREMQDERNREYNEMLRNKASRGQRQNQPPATPKQGWGTPTYEEMLDKKRAQESQYRRANDINFEGDHNAKENQPRPLNESRRGNQQDGQYFATLPLGSNAQDEQSRRKEEYKRDLQRQMAEAAYARKAERAQGILVNNNNLGNQQLTSPRLLYSDVTPRRRDRDLDAYHAKILGDIGKLDDSSANQVLNRRQPTGERRKREGLSLGPGTGGLIGGGGTGGGGGILDVGFDKSLLEPGPRLGNMEPPAGLQYQPSTYITANNAPTLNSSVDEAYNFYASLNPLDPSLASAVKISEGVGDGGGGGRGGGGGGGRGVPSLDLSGVGGEKSVRFADSRKPRAGPARGMEFGTDDDRKRDQREQQSAYREELERQMQERNRKKVKEREEKERYDRKIEEEARNYDPFGKGGGGAPMRDQFGNVISDLRQLRNDNQSRVGNQYSPRIAPGSFSPELGRTVGNSSRAGNSYRDDLIGPPPKQTTAEGEASYARGGHGIFGMPKTDAEKTQADRYKAELRRQIEEKRAEELKKKELQRLEEEREQKILDEQRAKMQQEYELEQAKIKAKEEEARLKNEEMMRAAEEKKLEIERKRREAEEERLRQQREERDRELEERRQSASPPVPAARTRRTSPDQPQSRLAQATQARPQSSDVLNQLANMRAQLQNERRRVQTMLDDQEDDVEIYDPRQVQRPPPAPVVNTRTEVDVFETALTRNPVAVRRTPGDRNADANAAEEFRNLKHKGNSDSRKHIRERYPDEPYTDSALEFQQQALIRRQEEQLRGGQDARAYDDHRDMRSSSSQLHSNSAFVDVNSVGHFPDDFEDLPKRNDSARHRRRTRVSSSPRVITPDFNSRATFGSQTSLNVDKLSKKNEERLRKLRDLQGDDISLYDPEDVLDRFMTKQAHNRPPSRNTLLDDTWLRAGSRQSKY